MLVMMLSVSSLTLNMPDIFDKEIIANLSELHLVFSRVSVNALIDNWGICRLHNVIYVNIYSLLRCVVASGTIHTLYLRVRIPVFLQKRRPNSSLILSVFILPYMPKHF